MIIEQAREEFTNADSEEKHKLIYAYFGLAVYQSQCLEETFAMMLWTSKLFQDEIKTSREVNEIIDKIEQSKRTMGNFINEIKKKYDLPEDTTKRLGIILDKRNYLVHKFFKLEIQKVYSEYGQWEMIEYFCKFIDEAKQLDGELAEYYESYRRRIGITDLMIEKIMAEFKQEEIARANKLTNK